MTETLTESFCERCGTRYTFETTQPRGRNLGALGTLGRGLRLFVTSSESSLDESLAEARSEAEQRVTAAQLEAFHRTFNFCLSCRQYTCADCWNAVEGRCLTCAPLPEAEIRQPGAIAIPVPSSIAGAPIVGAAPPIAVEPLIVLTPGDGVAGGIDAGPERAAAAIVEALPAATVADLELPPDLEPAPPALEPEPEAEVPPLLEAEPEAAAPFEAVSEAEPEAAAPFEAQPEAAAPFEAVSEAEPLAALVEPEVAPEVPEAETEVAETAGLESVSVEPGSEPEVAGAEPLPVAVEPEPEPEAAAAEPAAVEPEPVAVEPEPPSAPAEPAPPGPVAGKVALPEFLPGRSLDDEIAAYELRVAALADAPSEPLPRVVIEATRPAPGPSVRAEAEPRALPITPPESLPTPPVAAVPGTCRSCGLSISASARFCRRCGTAQQVA